MTHYTVTKGSGGLTAPGSGDELPHLVERGGLSFESCDAATGQRMPGKVTLIGVKGTPDPKLS